jgi:proline racemase
VQPQQPVIRTYRGRDRRSAEEAYRLDADAAARAAWFPVAHRWASSWAGDELSVVFEYRDEFEIVATPLTPAAYPYAMAATAPAPYVDAAPPQDRHRPVDAAPAMEPEPETASDGWSPEAAIEPEPERYPELSEDLEMEGYAAASSEAEPEVYPSLDGEMEPPTDSAWAPDEVVDFGEGAEPPADTAWSSSPELEAEPEPEPVGEAYVAPAAQPSEPPRTATTPAVRAHARAVVQAIDLHAAGEPLRLIRSGYPAVPLLPILERRGWLKENADYARRVLMFEPRGHRDMYGAILLPPFRDDADIAVLFMHNSGYSTMCGHGILAITTALVEEGLYPASAPETVIHFETPAGLVTATASVTLVESDRNEVGSVRFRNVPSYLHAAGLRVRPDGIELHRRAATDGALSVELAFGGAYYGIVDAADLGLRVVPEQVDALTRAGTAITNVLRRDHTPNHPTDRDLGFVYGTIIMDRHPATSPDGKATQAAMRNVTIFADGEVDRSPCGTGTSALLAWLHATGQIEVGQELVNAGITGETFRGRVEAEAFLGQHPAVVTSIEGNAYVTGYHTFVVDDRDPLGAGFLLR